LSTTFLWDLDFLLFFLQQFQDEWMLFQDFCWLLPLNFFYFFREAVDNKKFLRNDSFCFRIRNHFFCSMYFDLSNFFHFVFNFSHIKQIFLFSSFNLIFQAYISFINKIHIIAQFVPFFIILYITFCFSFNCLGWCL